MLSKLENFNKRISTWFSWIGIAGLLLMMIITFIDVIGGKLFSWRLPGSIDIVTVSQIIAIAFACALTLIAGQHINVELLVIKFPRKVQVVIGVIVSLLCLGFFILIIWRLFVFGYYMQIGNEGTGTIRIPLYLFCYAIAVAFIPVCFTFILKIASLLAKKERT